MSLPTDPDCYWVEPGRVMAGGYPGAASKPLARTKLNALLDCGVRTFIDLTEPHELTPYDALLSLEANGRGVTVTYHRQPIQDHGVPTTERMRDILDAMQTSLDRGEPVYVHCWGGIGRTGTVVGCWLVEQGMAGGDPIAALAELRAHPQRHRLPSPEMPEQETFVRDW